MEDAIATVRGFNRFYTRFIGALNARFLGSDLSLAETRLLFEIARTGPLLATDLQARVHREAGLQVGRQQRSGPGDFEQ